MLVEHTVSIKRVEDARTWLDYRIAWHLELFMFCHPSEGSLNIGGTFSLVNMGELRLDFSPFWATKWRFSHLGGLLVLLPARKESQFFFDWLEFPFERQTQNMLLSLPILFGFLWRLIIIYFFGWMSHCGVNWGERMFLNWYVAVFYSAFSRDCWLQIYER